MSVRYVEDLVGDMLEEGRNLDGLDLAAYPSGCVAINCYRVVMWHVEVVCLSYDV